VSIYDAHTAVKPRRDTLALMPKALDPQRTWRVEDDGEVFFYRASSRAQSIMAHAREIGMTYGEVVTKRMRARRAPALDGLEPTLYNAMAVGYVNVAEGACPGCGASLYADHDGNALVIYSGQCVQGDGLVFKDHDGALWCQRGCWEENR
jgi:hypothetical protein